MHQYEADGDDTFDYGLDPGESFEPDEIGEVDLTLPHIMTVLGPVEPGALGVTNLAASFVPRAENRDPATLLREIEEAGHAGLNALLDLRPIRSGDDAQVALWLAGRVDLHLIVASGPEADRSVSDNRQRIVAEAAHGIAGTDVRSGAIVTPLDVEQLRASFDAHIATGLPLIVDARGSGAELSRRIDAIAAAGIEPGAAVIAVDADSASTHAHLSDGWTYLLIAAGDESDGATIAELHRRRADSVIAGFDPPELRTRGLSRWSGLVELLPLQLLEAGLDALTARELLIDRPNNVLTIYPPSDANERRSPRESS